MVQRFARSGGIEPALSCNESAIASPAVPKTTPELPRYLTNAIPQPMYTYPGMDITSDITNYLNVQYTAPSQPRSSDSKSDSE